MADELCLWMMNDSNFYFKYIKPIVFNLARKRVKGIYKKDLAVKWISRGLIKDAMVLYTKKVGIPMQLPMKWREYAAKEILNQNEDWIADTTRQMHILKLAGKPWSMQKR
ncbi:MAG: hypothetical protein EOM59_16065 [Clostridia bacterium]|nr:hypothetical protein [Clostridia bacterium]